MHPTELKADEAEGTVCWTRVSKTRYAKVMVVAMKKETEVSRRPVYQVRDIETGELLKRWRGPGELHPKCGPWAIYKKGENRLSAERERPQQSRRTIWRSSSRASSRASRNASTRS